MLLGADTQPRGPITMSGPERGAHWIVPSREFQVVPRRKDVCRVSEESKTVIRDAIIWAEGWSATTLVTTCFMRVFLDEISLLRWGLETKRYSNSLSRDRCHCIHPSASTYTFTPAKNEASMHFIEIYVLTRYAVVSPQDALM